MSNYEYQPRRRIDAFDEGVLTLLRKGRVVSINCPPLGNVEDIAIELADQGLKTEKLCIDISDYRRYFDAAGYLSKYPQYYSGNLPEKSLEHYVALKLLALDANDVVLDLASEHSPLFEIYERLCGSKVYSQDIMYEKGVHGHRIGSDACAMPLPDGFATKALLTCSLEHFEADADTRLFEELYRVLQPGGMACIVPFYLASTAFTMTDPTISAVNDVPFDEGTILYCCNGWGNRHGRYYTPDSFHARIANHVKDKFVFNIYQLTNPHDISASCYVRFALTATRMG